MVYCEDYASANDVVTHEITHAVTESTAALVYLNQPGALNEAYSDVFAAMVDRNDWLIGEDLPIGVIRSLADPPAHGHPDHMNDFAVASVPPCSQTSDKFNGCVHFNSGIINKTAWLLSVGGTHHGVAVAAIGREEVERIYYRTLSARLTSTSDFGDAARETEAACRDLVGQYGITTGDCDQVAKAFQAVGL